MNRRRIFLLVTSLLLITQVGFAYWVWTPQSGKWTNPKNAVKDSPKEQFEWAQSFFEEESYKKAHKEFQKLANRYPKSSFAPEALFYSAESLMRMKKYYKAYQTFQKVVEKYPGSTRVSDVVSRQLKIGNHFFYGREKNIAGISFTQSYDVCIEIYEQIVKNAPYSSFSDRAQFYLGESYRKSGQFEAAIDEYNQLIERYPKSEFVPEARYKIALCSAHVTSDSAYNEQERKQAVSQFEQKMEEFGDMPRIQEAKTEMDALRQRNAQKLFDIANFYERQKNYKASILYYEDMIRKFPKSSLVDTAIDKIELLEKKSLKEGQ